MAIAPLPTPLSDARRAVADRLVALLPNVHPSTIEQLAETARLRTLRTGEAAYTQGEVVPLTLIIDGYAIATRTTSDGHQLASGVAQSGVLFGYSGIAAQPSSLSIIAVSRVSIAQWPGDEIRVLVSADPGFALAAIDSMAVALHQNVERVEGFLHQDARTRVLRILERHSALFFGEGAPLNRSHLPGLVGTTPEMTRRVLRQLEQEWIVERVGRVGLRLLRPEQLGGRDTVRPGQWGP